MNVDRLLNHAGALGFCVNCQPWLGAVALTRTVKNWLTWLTWLNSVSVTLPKSQAGQCRGFFTALNTRRVT